MAAAAAYALQQCFIVSSAASHVAATVPQLEKQKNTKESLCY